MKLLMAWFQMSVLVALVIGLPLALFGASRETIGGLSLIGGAVVLLAYRDKPVKE